MKKKLIVAVTLLLLIAISLTLFVGCDEIFTRNEERDMTQIVSTVTYEGQTAHIYKFELASSFNAYAYYYNSYYGMSYEEAADYILRSLAQQKLLVLYAKARVTELKGLEQIPDDISELLSDSENNKAIEDANESLLNSLKNLVKEDVTDDNYNSGTTDSDDDATEDDDDATITDAVYVRFESNGGSEVAKQKIQRNKKAKEPTDPTRDGYTFYGWYPNENAEGEEWNFDAPVPNDMKLYAKWEKYTSPRTAMPEEDEEDDYDPDRNFEEDEEFAKKFFDMTVDELFDEMKEEDFVEDIVVGENGDKDAELKKYITDNLNDLKNNLKKNLFKKTEKECYDYYLNQQYESLLTARLERMIGDKALADFNADIDNEITAEYNASVERNEESFAASDSAYSSALGSSLTSTYLNPDITGKANSYGFVINILLRLGDDELKQLTDMLANNPHNLEAVRLKRNYLLSQMQIKVSNPKYKADEPVLDADGNELELRDPMTDKTNPYGYIGATEYDHKYQNNKGTAEEPNYENDYSQIVSFEKDENGKYGIKFNAFEHPAMAYLLEEVPAFDLNGKTGIIHQIYNSFDQVKAATELTPVQRVYWLRKVAITWAYLVGDDTGAVTSSSNNNGLGYLISPEGKDSSYLDDFTSYARKLIQSGTGSFTADGFDAATAFNAAVDGVFAGDQKAFAVADSFIASGNTSNAYTGVFVLLNSLTVYDETFYQEATGNSLAGDGKLPLDYVMTFAEDEDDVKTVKDLIKEKLESTKKSSAYSAEVNAMGKKYMEEVEYFKDAYKSLWKDLD